MGSHWDRCWDLIGNDGEIPVGFGMGSWREQGSNPIRICDGILVGTGVGIPLGQFWDPTGRDLRDPIEVGVGIPLETVLGSHGE